MRRPRTSLAAALAAAALLTAATPAAPTSTEVAETEAATCRLDIAYARQAQIDGRVTVNAEDDVVAEVTCTDLDLSNYRLSARFFQLVDGAQRGGSQYANQQAVAGTATAVFTDREVFRPFDPVLDRSSQYCVELYSPQSRTVCKSPVIVGDLDIATDLFNAS